MHTYICFTCEYEWDRDSSRCPHCNSGYIGNRNQKYKPVTKNHDEPSELDIKIEKALKKQKERLSIEAKRSRFRIVAGGRI